MAFKVTKKVPAESKKVLKHSMGHSLAKKSSGPQYGSKDSCDYTHGSGQKMGSKCRGPI